MRQATRKRKMMNELIRDLSRLQNVTIKMMTAYSEDEDVQVALAGIVNELESLLNTL
jgi:hypothetical protein